MQKPSSRETHPVLPTTGVETPKTCLYYNTLTFRLQLIGSKVVTWPKTGQSDPLPGEAGIQTDFWISSIMCGEAAEVKVRRREKRNIYIKKWISPERVREKVDGFWWLSNSCFCSLLRLGCISYVWILPFLFICIFLPVYESLCYLQLNDFWLKQDHNRQGE